MKLLDFFRRWRNKVSPAPVPKTELLFMYFDKNPWCYFEKTPEENNESIAEQLALPARRIDEEWFGRTGNFEMRFKFAYSAVARKRYEKIAEIVRDFYSNHHSVKVFSHKLDGGSIIFLLCKEG